MGHIRGLPKLLLRELGDIAVASRLEEENPSPLTEVGDESKALFDSQSLGAPREPGAMTLERLPDSTERR